MFYKVIPVLRTLADIVNSRDLYIALPNTRLMPLCASVETWNGIEQGDVVMSG